MRHGRSEWAGDLKAGNINKNNPRALGTQGMVWPIYEQELRANPHPAPNFSKLHQFHDDALQVFHYNISKTRILS